jgi:hypothetical protein
MTAASAAVAETKVKAPAPEATTLADSAIADTAFKNLEPAFISPITFFSLVSGPRGTPDSGHVCRFTRF